MVGYYYNGDDNIYDEFVFEEVNFIQYLRLIFFCDEVPTAEN